MGDGVFIDPELDDPELAPGLDMAAGVGDGQLLVCPMVPDMDELLLVLLVLGEGHGEAAVDFEAV
ncbi:MAG: hypothetical protein JO322_00975 [Candidatus Eremiobacteraeota bacterium]|nr:hypothetical protein [Candidatus Eremiobacteraeota bacterium]